MMGYPKQDIYGITSKRFKKFENVTSVQPISDTNSCIIEIWRHEMPIKNGIVHPLGIAVELKSVFDERVEDQLELMIEDYFKKEL